MVSFRKRMEKKKKSLQKRHNAKSSSGGSRFPTIFLKNKIPSGVDFFKVKEGRQIVDIIPWVVGPDMPYNDQNAPITDEGELDYILDIRVHQNVGKMNKPFVCPYENFDLPCPICEFMKENRLEKEEWSKLNAKRRSIYLVWDRKSAKTEKKGLQIFDAAHFFMEEKLEEIATKPRGGGRIPFSHWDKGKHVVWKRKGTGKTNTRYVGHSFMDRESGVPNKILDQGFALDQVIHMHPTYEEIEKEFYGTKKSKKRGKDLSGKKRKKKKSRVSDDDIDDSRWGPSSKKKKKKKKKDERRKRPTDRKKVGKKTKEKRTKKKKRSRL